MEIVKKHKNVLKFSLFLLTASLALTGCSNKATMPSAQQKQQNRQNQQQNVQLGVYMGDVAQDQNMLTIPVIINNTGTNKTVISSQNFTLKIDGHKFKSLQVPGETSDFHDDLASNGCWQNTVSFYVGTKLSNKLLQSVELTYLGDNGKQIKAEYIKSEEAPKQMITLGFKEILEAKQILLLASGKHKAQAVKDTLEGPITEDCPASVLRNLSNVTVIIDEEAASLLNNK